MTNTDAVRRYRERHPDRVKATLNRQRLEQPKGYAAIPGTGPAGETCTTCQHIARARKYRKCRKVQGRWTHGPGTDIKARSPACSQWAKAIEAEQ